ncbi:DNA gyrase/topoisomerase IV subunit A [Portibacter lacus]|uniref:DNA topoisomerase IV subunit A n=1 Tax=Portibacter lacus TaxID=1099794 RepID=A0AA37WG91_9BACT|nr:DNA gyrase/topoisomerase IV subunit A [Portibacter lacus]GLR18194.1 DNA topoisomerase IV subunit A [Portibacter lacus]
MEEDKNNGNLKGEANSDENIVSISGMYEDYFLDYASYVILERAIPTINDGLKPVQRRILYSMKEKDDGRYHKVANLIGHTMQYHPHGDAAIGDALVKLGQKDLMIDCQGNWGDTRTGDSAAAARYIEARLTKFALEVGFNAQTTNWQLSYDGRNKEPINLPVKFPLLLSQGADGIAVGLSTKILPHNFNELIKASIKILQGKKVNIYPDFDTGGSIDVSEYNGGKRGGKVKVRSKIEITDKNFLAIKELPYATTTTSLIDSIIKANDKGKIKIKKVIDNTARDVEVLIELASGVSPEVTMDALYAFTLCEISISPNACVIIDNKPHFLTVEEILETSTFNTKDLLRQELEIRKGELEEKWHFASLEKIFIENRIYRDIEECETWEEVIEAIDVGLKKYIITPGMTDADPAGKIRLTRDITEDDILRLTEIKIKRISKFNTFKADELIANIEQELSEVEQNLATLTEYTIAYFERLLSKYGKDQERKTTITTLETIEARQVVANNAKLYVNYKEGFVGTGLKKDEFIGPCSDIDDIIAFKKDGSFQVSRVSDKVFVGKNIIHAAVWKKGDDRTTYNMFYVDSKTGRTMAKRFQVQSITRDKSYDLTKGGEGSKVLYFTSNPNGEIETVSVQLSPGCSAKKKVFEFDFNDIAIKGRGAGGNIVTKYPIKKVTQIEVGKSSLGALKYYMDEVSGRLNKEERGKYLGQFDTGDLILAIYKDGSYELKEPDEFLKYDVKELEIIEKFNPDAPVSVVYYEGEKGWTMVKRFQIETSTLSTRFHFITEHRSSKLFYVSTHPQATLHYTYKSQNEKFEEDLVLQEFIDIKGWKALGNKLGDYKLLSTKDISPEIIVEDTSSEDNKSEEEPKQVDLFGSVDPPKKDDDLNTGDTIEFDV